jgi:hypothetical protein
MQRPRGPFACRTHWSVVKSVKSVIKLVKSVSKLLVLNKCALRASRRPGARRICHFFLCVAFFIYIKKTTASSARRLLLAGLALFLSIFHVKQDCCDVFTMLHCEYVATICCAALCVFLCSEECSSNVGGCHALVLGGGEGGGIGRQAADVQETLDVPHMSYCNNSVGNDVVL